MEIENSKYSKFINGKIELTDMNGKSITTTFDEITDATGDANAEFSDVENSIIKNANINCTITDSESGSEMSREDLVDAINNNEISAIDITFEATHTNMPINSSIYTEDSMMEDVSTFITPYGKPLIKNHDSYEEPLGRIINASYDDSDFLEDTGTINATWRVTDKDAMTKFADGRYKTMSIGASCSKIVCNTCGKTILKNGKVKFCGHWRGETYKDSLCTWTMTGLKYQEGSVVNKPADPYAQVKNMKVIKRKNNSSKGVNNMENNQQQNGLSQIDNILNGNQQQPATDANQQLTVDPNANNSTDTNAQDSELETLKNELASVKNELETVKNDLVIRDGEVEALKAEKIISDSKIQSQSEQLVSLAKLNKSLLIDNAISLDNNLKAEDLEKQTASQIGAIINSLKTVRRIPKKVDDPTLSNRDHEDESNQEAQIENKSNCKDLKDFEAVVNKFFTGNN